MKLYLIFTLLSFSISAQKVDPFSIELRPRLIDNAKVIVTVEITNHLNQPIDYLEGFYLNIHQKVCS